VFCLKLFCLSLSSLPTTASEREAGVWAVGDYEEWWGGNNLPNAERNAQGFYEVLVSEGFTLRDKHFGSAEVDEEQFYSPDYGGKDYNYTDACDIIFYSGHGEEGKLVIGTNWFPQSYDKVDLTKKVEWGDLDLEWAILSSCSTPNRSVINDLKSAFDTRLHGMCGYHSGTFDVPDEGYYFAKYATEGSMSIGVVGAILCGGASDGSLIFYNEYLPGYGSGMYPDPQYGSGDWGLWYHTWVC